MLGHITFVVTVLCIAVMLTLFQYDYAGKPIRRLWLLFLVTAIAFAWLLVLDMLKGYGLALADREWCALVFRGSIGLTATGVLVYNWWGQHGARRRGNSAYRRHGPASDTGVVR